MTDATGPEKKRRPWAAGLLSLLLPGLGQFYNGDLRLALVLLIGSLVAVPNAIWLIASFPSRQAAVASLIILIAAVAVFIFAVIQAVLRARSLGVVKLARFQRWYVYAGIYVAMVIWGTAGDLLPVSRIQSYSMPSSSMMPTLLIGDRHASRTLAFVDRVPERGEIAVFASPEDETLLRIGRIVGLPGDRIQMREGRLYVNDVVVEREQIEDFRDPSRPNASAVAQYVETLPGGTSYRIIEVAGDAGALDDTPVVTVPDGHVFTMGDNRDGAADSRYELGPVPIGLLRDKPMFLFWAEDLSRIGTVIE